MKMNLDYIKETLETYKFPLKAYPELEKCFKGIAPMQTTFEQQIALYENDMLFSFGGSIKTIRLIAEKTNESAEVLSLLYIVFLTKHLKIKYEEKGIGNLCFDGVMEDIRSKTDECFTIYGIYGTSVPEWFGRYFSLTRFALGRLQFQLDYLNEDIDINGEKLYKRQLAVSIHIPSGKPLCIEECKKSLSLAYDWFFSYFEDETVIFQCESWLLSPQNKILLNENSNIRKFMDLFYVFEDERTAEGDLWRIFGNCDLTDYKNLPTDNSLRLKYAKYLQSGRIIHRGIGILLMKNNKDFPN